MADHKPRNPAETKPPVDEPKLPTPEAEQLRLKEVFPNVETLFTLTLAVSEIIKDCVYVLDTSCLLAPLEGGRETLDEFRKILTDLVAAGRVRLPAQVVREYVRRRSDKISEIYAEMKRWENLAVPVVDNRMLRASAMYPALTEKCDNLKQPIREFKETLKSLINEVRESSWNDPVTKTYSEIFEPEHFCEHALDDETLRADFRRRCEKGIPPGIKDRDKAEGIGDLAIWHSILAVGKGTKGKARNVVFVSGEKKNDWFVQSNKEAIAVRYELVNEFLRETGQSFTILDFSEFLRLNGAKDTVIEEAKVAEAKLAEEAEEELRAYRALLDRTAARFANFTEISDSSRSIYGFRDDRYLYTLSVAMSGIRELKQTLVAATGSMNPVLLGKVDKYAEEVKASLNRIRHFSIPDVRLFHLIEFATSQIKHVQHSLMLQPDDGLRTLLQSLHNTVCNLEDVIARLIAGLDDEPS